MDIFEQSESRVRFYSELFPTVFKKSKGTFLFDVADNCYIDFFCAAGSLNYGHNNNILKDKLINYIKNDGITNSLDMKTTAKAKFLNIFDRVILSKRKLKYKIQFPGPTGTNSIEAALKLARKITGYKNIIYFKNSFHGMTLGSLSVSFNPKKRKSAGIPLNYCVEFPFSNQLYCTVSKIEKYIKHAKNTSNYPAAIILETIQAEGGVNIANIEWLKEIEYISNKNNIILIIDDIQVGCGRTGNFFSFEKAGIYPDIVCLSKSLSGYGLPFSVVLIKPEFDIWEPHEHNGTFRGNNFAFVTATEAISHYWSDTKLADTIYNNSLFLKDKLYSLKKINKRLIIRGYGLIWGIDVLNKDYANKIQSESFKQGLLIESCGINNSVLKIMPPLTIKQDILNNGIEIIKKSLQ